MSRGPSAHAGETAPAAGLGCPACFAPIITVQASAVDEAAPEAHRAEAYTWLGTLYGVGSAAGAALAGQLIVGSGVRAALVAAVAATKAAWLLASLSHARMARNHLGTPASGEPITASTAAPARPSQESDV